MQKNIVKGKVGEFLAELETRLKAQKVLLKRFALALEKYESSITELETLANEIKMLGITRTEIESLFTIDSLIMQKLFKRKARKPKQEEQEESDMEYSHQENNPYEN